MPLMRTSGLASSLWRASLALLLALITAASYAQFSNPADDVAAYHAGPPRPGEHVAPILSGSALHGPAFRFPWQLKVYKLAVRIPNVIWQLPCQCRCDRTLGHTSLHSCFETTHGTACSECARETVYAWQMTQKGMTPAQIRQGIVRGDYNSIDLNHI